jgi:hypothetical protein
MTKRGVECRSPIYDCRSLCSPPFNIPNNCKRFKARSRVITSVEGSARHSIDIPIGLTSPSTLFAA